MNVSRRYPVRLVLAIVAAAAVLVVGAVTASGQGAGPSDESSGGGGISGMTGSSGIVVDTPIAVTPPNVAVKAGIATPAWCCGTSGYVPGLTTVGQATVDGQSPSARDAAIAAAVQDATAQANAAAEAAGIQLGAIIDMQVSAMPYLYPMMGGVSATSTGSMGSSGGGMEPAPAPDMYQSSVSVTVTWSLG